MKKTPSVHIVLRKGIGIKGGGILTKIGMIKVKASEFELWCMICFV